MLEATARMPIREFGKAPAIEYVTLRVDVTQGCLANPFTPPEDIDVLQYVAGSEPTLAVCTQPTEYQLLVVPSVIGLDRRRRSPGCIRPGSASPSSSDRRMSPTGP